MTNFASKFAFHGAILAVAAIFLSALSATAQQKEEGKGEAKVDGKDAEKLIEHFKSLPNLVLAGYTTPGSPLPAKLKSGTGRIIGGTIYFAVFKNTGKIGDRFGVRDNFDSLFVEGENIRKDVSPAFDSEAEYLYLYQVVNDRAIHDTQLNKPNPEGISFAANKENDKVNLTEDVANFSLGLTCDPRYVTSWGYFADTGFAVRVIADAKLKKAGEASRIMAVSSHPAIEDRFPKKEYKPWAKKNLIDPAKVGFGLADDKAGLDSDLALVKKRMGGIRFVNFEQTAKRGGQKPDMVQIIALDTQARQLGDPDAPLSPYQAILRVDWKKMAIPEAEHSVVFGYTSDLPPVDTVSMIKDREAAAQVSDDPAKDFQMPKTTRRTPVENQMPASLPQLAANLNAQDTIRLVATQAVAAQDPAPAPGPAPAAGVAPSGGMPSPSGAPAGGGGAPGGGFLSPAAAGGGAPPGGGGGMPAPGGGGALGAARPAQNGGITGGQEGGQEQGETQNQAQTPTLINNNINTLTNSQKQQQQQQQKQNQNQSQKQTNNNNGCPCDGNVVPEPGAMLMGLLGLPGLWFFYRRKLA